MKLTWYGNASLVLEEAGCILAFDPFCGLAPGQIQSPPQALPYERELRRARHVLVTHGHFDHIYHLPRLYQDTDTRIYCTQTPERTLIRHGMNPERIIRIGDGWQGKVGPFTIRAYQSRHCQFDKGIILQTACQERVLHHPGPMLELLKLDAAYPEHREILLYDVTGEKTRMQIMGSMNLAPNRDYPQGADVLVLPLQGRSDQDTYALGLVRRLRPKAVFLDHCDDAFPPLSSDVNTAGFLENVKREFGIPCTALKRGQCMVLEDRRTQA